MDPLSAAGAAKAGAELVKAAGNVRVRRFNSQLKILQKAQKMAEDAGYDARVVNLKVLVLLLDAGSLEDDSATDDGEHDRSLGGAVGQCFRPGDQRGAAEWRAVYVRR